jgi:hypothetical protein
VHAGLEPADLSEPAQIGEGAIFVEAVHSLSPNRFISGAASKIAFRIQN